MKRGKIAYMAVLVIASVVAMGLWAPVGGDQAGEAQEDLAPRYQVDPF
jgi:hypothetical protein